jgi:transposase-like protein
MGRTTTAAEGKWREMLDRQRASGLSVAAFCRRHGVCAASLYAWKRRLRSVAAAPPFVEAKVTGVPAAAEAAGVIEVCLRGGRRLRVGRGFDARLLSELVVALEGLS